MRDTLKGLVRETYDLDQILNWYSGQIFIGNHDFLCNNQILYRHREGGPWKILAWDMDNVLHDATDPANYGNRENPNDTGQWSLLIDRLLSIPSLMRRHLENLESLLGSPLSDSSVLGLFDQWEVAVVDDAEIDVAKYTREQPDRYYEFVGGLRVFFEERNANLRASIDELMPEQWCDLAINEIVRDVAAVGGPREEVRSAVELHYRGRSSLVATDLHLSNDLDSPLKWPIPPNTFSEGDLMALDLPEELGLGDWIGLSVGTPSETLLVDSFTLGGTVGDRSVGRFPDGSGRIRVLSEETLGAPNRWEEPVTVIAEPDREIYEPGDAVHVDLTVTSLWRDSIDVDLEVEIVCPDGIWCFDGPIASMSIPVLGGGDSVRVSFGDSIPLALAPESEGRYDIVFTPEESSGQRLAPAVATIYALGQARGIPLINELCARNASVIADEQGEFEDWVEIVNDADSALSTAGLYLSDDVDDDPFEWSLPPLQLDPGECLLIWLDNEPTEGPLHASFKLNGDGEEIGLIRSIADSVLILDRIPFGYQETDWSFGRYPSSAPNWEFFDVPTPAAANVDPVLRY